MAFLQKKVKNGHDYWYVMEAARVNGQPRIVRQRYLGTVEAIEAAFDAAFEPESIDDVEFGATATMWTLAQRIGFGLSVDARLGRTTSGLSVGTYLQAAAVNRAVSPRSKRGFFSWYDQSVLARIVPAAPQAWISPRFWDAMHVIGLEDLEAIEQAYVSQAVAEFAIALEALVFDGTNFHTYIASTNPKAPIAQRGHAKNKRFDLRLVGLALACSTDHRIPLVSSAVAGNTPDVKVFEAALPKLISRLEALGVEPASITVVFDKGNNSRDKLAARVDEALSPRWMARLYRTQITGATREDLALAWSFDEEAFAELRDRELGKRVIFTDRAEWSTSQIVVAYRSQWEAEAAFRQIKNPEHASFRPIHHWTDHKIRVHALYSVAALMMAKLAGREAGRGGLELS